MKAPTLTGEKIRIISKSTLIRLDSIHNHNGLITKRDNLINRSVIFHQILAKYTPCPKYYIFCDKEQEIYAIPLK